MTGLRKLGTRVPFSLRFGGLTRHPETARYRSAGVPHNAGSERYRRVPDEQFEVLPDHRSAA